MINYLTYNKERTFLYLLVYLVYFSSELRDNRRQMSTNKL